jgi:hypothetical protein
MDQESFSATAEIAFQSYLTVSNSPSSFWMKDSINVSSAIFPDGSMFPNRPLEMIITQDHHNENTEKFVFPVEESSNISLSQVESDTNPQNRPDQILKVSK